MSDGTLLRAKELRGELRAENARLEPCKYCGKKPFVAKMQSLQRREGRDAVWWVKCKTKKCPGKIYRYYLSPETAVREWNRRMRP